MAILWGRFKSATGTVDTAVFQRTVDYLEDHAPGYHVILDGGPLVTVPGDEAASASGGGGRPR